MAINRQFGRDLSDKLMNGAFAGVRRGCVISQQGDLDPISETYAPGNTHTGLCILTKLTRKDFESQSAQDAEFVIKKRCAEVVDDTTGELFEVRNDNTNIKVQQLSPIDDTDLGLVDAVIVDVQKDGVDAVYTIYGKYK